MFERQCNGDLLKEIEAENQIKAKLYKEIEEMKADENYRFKSRYVEILQELRKSHREISRANKQMYKNIMKAKKF